MAFEAYRLLFNEMAVFRELPYEQLAEFIGQPHRWQVTVDGVAYAIEITVGWRYAEGGEIRVIGWAAVDDCGPMRRVDDTFVVSRD
jgi:hypothetical protein